MSAENNALTRALIVAARSGSEDALTELISKYEPLINALISKYDSSDLSGEDKKDMRQEALIIFCNAVMKYNLEQNDVDFGLYAKICIERGFLSQIRAFRRRLPVESIDDNKNIVIADDPSLALIDSENVREIWKLIDENLSEYESKVWNMHLIGNSSADIALQLGRDVKSIDNALCRIRAKLRKVLKRQYN